jgi:cobalt-zinc-cadmium efflux system membrane fusion protein
VDRVKDLREHKAIAEKEVLNAQNALDQARATLDQNEANAKQALRRLEILGLQPGQFGQKLTVRAPLSGKVLEITAVPGEFRNDTSAGVITIADLHTVWVSSDVPETDIRFIQPGERLDIELSAYPGEKFHGRVTRIADSVDPETRTIKVRAELDNSQGRLRPEMFGRIRHVESTERIPVVPDGAVIQGDNRNTVYKEAAPGTFVPVRVEVGNKVGDLVGIVRGLKAGDRVVTDGAMLLRN